VVFQADPFAALPREGLCVGLESRRFTLATEPHNARWLRIGFGRETLHELSPKPISCSGVTYGDAPSIKRYLGSMVRGFEALGPLASGENGLDQALHNVLLWRGDLGRARLMETLSSPIATLGSVTREEIRLDPEGFVLNVDGTRAAIVHQHDRHPTVHLRMAAAS
jgi:hypothetical protein